MEITKQRRTSLLMFPWSAHGHVSPFLELAKKFTNTKRNFSIYFCSTPVNLNSIKPKLSPKYSCSIHFVELNLLSLPEPPPHCHTTKGLPPHLVPKLKEAFDMASPSFFNILKTLKPDLLVYDLMQPWAPVLASSLNIPAVHFLCTSASMVSCTLHLLKKPGEDFPFPAIYLKGYMKAKFGQMVESSSASDRPKDSDSVLQCFERSSHAILVKTFRELEGKYLDYLSVLLNKKMVPVGPLVQDPTGQEDDQGMDIIQWLDKKESSSAVFVSFGSEYFLSKEEREEIAYGLELSKLKFIWVLRFPVGERMKLEEALPEGYLERISTRGLVIEVWAPQARIIGHPSIGGFVSHCGWSSVMESMKFGVPIIAMPMQIDQPFNARLVEDVGVGIEVDRNMDGGFEREEIAKVIREVVVDQNGESVRKKARGMSNHIRNRGEEEMDEVIDELVQLCAMRTKP